MKLKPLEWGIHKDFRKPFIKLSALDGVTIAYHQTLLPSIRYTLTVHILNVAQYFFLVDSKRNTSLKL